ncbi:MAG: helix-turn-helix transcriptional regulator [Bacteroidota bacterium]
MDTNSIISKNIRDLRVKYGYTQAFIAEYLNLTSAAVNQYENDARTIPTSVVEKLALLFDVEEYDLFEENPEKRQLISSFAFRAGELSAQDMQSVSKFKKVILNYLNMSSARANG